MQSVANTAVLNSRGVVGRFREFLQARSFARLQNKRWFPKCFILEQKHQGNLLKFVFSNIQRGLKSKNIIAVLQNCTNTYTKYKKKINIYEKNLYDFHLTDSKGYLCKPIIWLRKQSKIFKQLCSKTCSTP